MAVMMPYSALRGSRSGALSTLLFIRAKDDRAAWVSLPGGSGGCCRYASSPQPPPGYLEGGVAAECSARSLWTSSELNSLSPARDHCWPPMQE